MVRATCCPDGAERGLLLGVDHTRTRSPHDPACIFLVLPLQNARTIASPDTNPPEMRHHPPKDTVRKAVIHKFDPDPYKSIVLVSEPLRPPKRTEVQVAVLYAGFAGSEVNMGRGTYPGQPSPPFTPGYAMVGRVLSLGPSARRGFAPGDVVAALTVYGADAERINVDERHLIHVPADVDLPVAAALPLNWCTALGLVEHCAKVQQGHKVFVHGLSGAVGQAAMTLCLQKGGTVYGTASARNHAQLRSWGAHPFVYTDKAWVAAMRELGGVDAVLDPLGYESWDESYSILATSRPSVLVGYGLNLRSIQGDGRERVVKSAKLETARQLAEMARLQAFNLKLWEYRSARFFAISRDSKTYTADLERLLALVKAGDVTVPIKKVWDLEDVREAHRNWGKAEGMGSVVIRVSD
ncbi:hypothetical protein MAPG_11462 [Magnaporthiopsis poae ATCC 64411]|uniref:Enoyl reductase (ER) domain-containing protein n=1 Tax=Magnaporthiopsis poae (strain ATCC 64411 / 73-15) TaxID=644358 RepID=A0A0C4EFC0_MAGP6|nr:hypothetical protein MAPG_11462 [Magnaporthiopsis poae ATCC 64411]